jgi:quercetin dioxygenase-like cupin family protein
MDNRLFPLQQFRQISPKEPIRSVICHTDVCTVVLWHVLPGQKIAPHTHPKGQDTWMVQTGHALYISDLSGTKTMIGPGDVVIAHAGQVHGAIQVGDGPFEFVSVVAPGEAGFQLADIS